ncbi:MFS transporter [Spirochaeta dissipatitropha]
MKNYILFLRSHLRKVGFGFSFTFFSSLGQTFLISLYVPYILEELSLSNSLFGTMYAAATVTSSVLLINFGSRIDYRPLKSYVYRTLIILAAASLALGLIHSPILLPLALLGLRFAGQGLMSHISQTVIGRSFDSNRGKALSLSSLGYATGEMIFPVVITMLIPLVGWRTSLAMNGAILIAVMLPLLRFLPMDELDTAGKNKGNANGGSKASRSHWGVVRQQEFWSLMPVLIVLSATTTGVFFYQIVMAESRGWNLELYSVLFSGYAFTRFLFGLFGGSLVDRFSARRLFSLHLLPLITGLIFLALSQGTWGAAVFLFLAGISIGCSSPIKSAVIAEIHGVANLGGIRSVYTAFAVFGTAMGPMLFGFMLDSGFSFAAIFLSAAVLLSIALLPTFRSIAVPEYSRIA